MVYLEAVRQLFEIREELFDTVPACFLRLLGWLEMLTSMTTYIEVERPHLAVQTSWWMAKVQSATVDVLLGTWADVLPAICQLNALARQIRPRGGSSNLEKTVLDIEDNLLDEGSEDLGVSLSRAGFDGLEDTDDQWVGGPAPNVLCSPISDLFRSRSLSVSDTSDFDGIAELITHGTETDGSEDDVQSTNGTLSEHCRLMAHAYRLGALLQLYHSYPFVLSRRLPLLPEYSTSTPTLFLQLMSTYIISLLEAIPLHSRVLNVCSFPLMTAAQFATLPGERAWARRVVNHLRLKNGIAVVLVLGETLEEVWHRRDGGEDVVWTSVFQERGCKMMIN